MIYKYYYVFLFITLLHISCCQELSQGKPNIVLIITDDQDSVLGGITPMKRTQQLIAKNGATFVNSFVAAPVCCPSRSSILTGMYPHNHQTTNNSFAGGCSNKNWQDRHEPNTFASLLRQEANYATFYAGKYLNEYGKKEAGGPEHVPIGWNEWRGLVGNSKYYNFTLSHNGVPKEYNNGEYLTDVIRDMAIDFIKEESKSAFNNPLLLVLAPPAPHAPFEPAERHKDTFKDIQALNTPNFNIPPGKDKHWIMRMPPSPLPNDTLIKLDYVFRSRWETLLSVDEMVESVIQCLENENILNNTYIIFTSDNGFHIGQFSQPIDKRQPYETDIRVPLIIRGPGIEEKSLQQYPTTNIDLAPTILVMAGLEPLPKMDGIPLPIFQNMDFDDIMESSLLTNSVHIQEYDRFMLVEYSGESSEKSEKSGCPWEYDSNLALCNPEYSCKCQDTKNNTYGCIRHLHPKIDYIYCAFKDHQEFEEAYNIKEDPYQIENSINTMLPSVKYKYQTMLSYLSECKGPSCNDEYYD